MSPLSSEQQRTLPRTCWTWILCAVGVVGALLAFVTAPHEARGAAAADLDSLRPRGGPASHRSGG